MTDESKQTIRESLEANGEAINKLIDEHTAYQTICNAFINDPARHLRLEKYVAEMRGLMPRIVTPAPIQPKPFPRQAFAVQG